ncbi:MAG TPA: amino acid ABC transporter permease [Burkholderiaceae bacterium]|nr:amino acid ABC transporter permease [Burkholderiaceae bacterium]
MFRSERVRNVLYQVLLLAAVVGVGWYLVSNTVHNLEARNIQSGFGFLGREAGFEIAEKHVFGYEPSDSYSRALLIGIVNTLIVAAIGVVVATVLGTLIGIARLSSNWLLAKLASAYVEVMRNVPLLLQLFVWYGLFTELLPPVREALDLGGVAFASQRGFRFAWPADHPAWTAVAWAIPLGVAAALAWRARALAVQRATGRPPRVGLPALGLVLGVPAIAWLAFGAPTEIEVPELAGFDFEGGVVLTPEFTALMIGLSTYTAAFIAEVVRAGILAVDRGQGEAAMALGLTPGQRLRLVTLPQALRVIIPPMTSQYLNLTKNSSLAVAIGYPDLVSVANTTMNQTGQAIEAIAILMAVYLIISLAISMFMNWYNDRVRLVER